MSTSDALARLRAICSKLPDAPESIAWGHPNWRAGGAKGRIFMSHEGKDPGAVCLRFDREFRAALLDGRRFTSPPHAGGVWVQLDLGGHVDWREVESLAKASYDQTAKPAPKTPRRKRA
jgi:predicted DNA-binding protein (MmcQ/YjbR family)